jgi:RHS repeat-associated protein
VLDSTGAVKQDIRYDPYGSYRRGSGYNCTDKRFTSQQEESDAPLLLYNYGARFYSTRLGRFLSAASCRCAGGKAARENTGKSNYEAVMVDPMNASGEPPAEPQGAEVAAQSEAEQAE